MILICFKDIIIEADPEKIRTFRWRAEKKVISYCNVFHHSLLFNFHLFIRQYFRDLHIIIITNEFPPYFGTH